MRKPGVMGELAVAAGMTFLLHRRQSMDPLVRAEALPEVRYAWNPTLAGRSSSGYGPELEIPE